MPDVQIPTLDGARLGAYAALPRGGNGPGLLVVHETAGIDSPVSILCDRLAGRGFIALCPDLLGRQKAEANAFDIAAGLRDLFAVLAYMRHMPGCNGKAGALGFGRGGTLAFLMAARTDIDCAASYYGAGMDAFLEETEDIGAPFLLHLAEKDSLMPKETREKILAAVHRNVLVSSHTYPGAEHAFAIPEYPGFNQKAAAEAEARTLAFLTKHLLGG